VRLQAIRFFAYGLALVIAAAARGDKQAEKPAEKEDLSAAIKHGIELIEAGKSTEFLERYMTPDDIEKMKKSGNWDKITAEFKKGHSDDLLNALNFIKDANPRLSDNGQTAAFNVSKLEGKHPPELKFLKIKDVWYINPT
jgi:hypothetical protein